MHGGCSAEANGSRGGDEAPAFAAVLRGDPAALAAVLSCSDGSARTALLAAVGGAGRGLLTLAAAGDALAAATWANVQLLLVARADPQAPSHDPPLVEAAASAASRRGAWFGAAESRRVVQALLDAAADVNAQRGPERETALMEAACAGDVLLCRLLVEARADAGLESRDGALALDFVPDELTGVDGVALRALLEPAATARPAAVDADGRSALHLAAAAVPAAGSPEDIEERCSTLRRLVEGRADVDARDLLGETPLSLAVRSTLDAAAAAGRGSEAGEVVLSGIRTLLELGAEVDAVDDLQGETPLMEAACRGAVAICELLLAARADAGRPSHSGLTALVLAEAGGHSSVVELLKGEAGAECCPGEYQHSNEYVETTSVDEALGEEPFAAAAPEPGAEAPVAVAPVGEGVADGGGMTPAEDGQEEAVLGQGSDGAADEGPKSAADGFVPKYRPMPPLAAHLPLGGGDQRPRFKVSMMATAAGPRPTLSFGASPSLRPSNLLSRPGLVHPNRPSAAAAAAAAKFGPGAGVGGAAAGASAAPPPKALRSVFASAATGAVPGVFAGRTAPAPSVGGNFAAKGLFRAAATAGRAAPSGAPGGLGGKPSAFRPHPRSGPTPGFAFPKPGFPAGGNFFGFGPGGPVQPGPHRRPAVAANMVPPSLERHYRALGVQLGAGLDEVRQAYRKLALQYHPDKNTAPGALETFRRVQEAYEAVCRHLQ